MKFFTYLIAALISLSSYANEQYSEYHCNALKQEKQRIQERFTQGYGAAESNYLNDRDREIFQIMRKHCVKPTSQTRPRNQSDLYQPEPAHQPPAYNSKVINDNWSAKNRIYQGEKLEAWEAFYKMPARCRLRQSSHDDFIYCADDKAQQKQQFEQNWKSRGSISR